MAKRRLRGSNRRAFFTCGSLVGSTRNATHISRAGATRGTEIPLDGDSRVPRCNVVRFDVCLDRAGIQVQGDYYCHPLGSPPSPTRMKRTVKKRSGTHPLFLRSITLLSRWCVVEIELTAMPFLFGTEIRMCSLKS